MPSPLRWLRLNRKQLSNQLIKQYMNTKPQNALHVIEPVSIMTASVAEVNYHAWLCWQNAKSFKRSNQFVIQVGDVTAFYDNAPTWLNAIRTLIDEQSEYRKSRQFWLMEVHECAMQLSFKYMAEFPHQEARYLCDLVVKHRADERYIMHLAKYCTGLEAEAMIAMAEAMIAETTAGA